MSAASKVHVAICLAILGAAGAAISGGVLFGYPEFGRGMASGLFVGMSLASFEFFLLSRIWSRP